MVTNFRLANTPRFWNSFNVTLPSINANTTAEVGIPATTYNSGGEGQAPAGYIAAHPLLAGTGAVAFPASLIFSHAYFNTTDSKIYLRFANVTASNYTAADVVTMQVCGW